MNPDLQLPILGPVARATGRLGGLDRRMSPQAARMELDPSSLYGPIAITGGYVPNVGRWPACPEYGPKPDGAVDRTRIHGGSISGQQRCLHAGCGGQAHLDRFPVGAEGAPSTARPQQCERQSMLPLHDAEAEEVRGGHDRAD